MTSKATFKIQNMAKHKTQRSLIDNSDNKVILWISLCINVEAEYQNSKQHQQFQ